MSVMSCNFHMNKAAKVIMSKSVSLAPVYRWSVMDKQVTSTPPPIPENGGGGGGCGYLYLYNRPPADWEPSINVDMVNSLLNRGPCRSGMKAMTVLQRRNLPLQEYTFPFPKHKEVQFHIFSHLQIVFINNCQ